MDSGVGVRWSDLAATVLLGWALWPVAAFGQTPSSCALLGPERAAELDWTARQTPVPIVDEVLAERLRACFGKGPSEPIVRGDLHRLRSLRHQGDHLDAIVRLDGLELAVNLQELLLPDNQIADIRPLSGLTALTNLDLARNQVADATPLADYAERGPDATVNLAGNPLSRASLNEALPRVAQHGVGLEFDRPDVLLFPTAHHIEGLLRIINHSPRSGEIEMFEPVSQQLLPGFELAGGGAVNFVTWDLTRGNAHKGLARGFDRHPGRIEFRTDLDIEVLVYARDGDGLLTTLHDAAPMRDGLPQFDTVNPGSNGNQMSFVAYRKLNFSGPGDFVLLSAYDDAGARREVEVLIGLDGYSAAELEDAGLGDGTGKWRIEASRIVRRDGKREFKGWSLINLPGGELSNLSTRPHRLEAPLFPSAADWRREGFVRVANHSHAGTVRIFATDDAGGTREPVELALAARQTRHFNSRDLEAGNPQKGLSGGIGEGTGDWRLRFESDLNVVALTYVRHADGFVTSMHDVAPNGLGRHRVATFVPASNGRSSTPWFARSTRSLLRIVNVGTTAAEVEVSGTDDLGRPGAGVVRLAVPAGAATTLTAAQLEEGGPELSGRLGKGEGMWRLSVESAQPLRVMSLMESDRRLTNISSAMRGPGGDADGDGEQDHADIDDDNDGIADAWDALPYDPTESVDTDGDGIGNLADTDDDGDGVEDALDASPLDASGHEPPNVADLRHYRFVGEHQSDLASWSVAVADVDCDGAREVVIGAPGHVGPEGGYDGGNHTGAVYLASAMDLPAADAADGQADGIVHLGRVAAEPRSWKLIGDNEYNHIRNREPHYVGTSVAQVGDINGDGCADLLVGGRALDGFAGSAYLVSALDLLPADGADGSADGIVNIRRLAEQPGSYEFVGERGYDNVGVAVAGMPDWDGDGFDELVVGAPWHSGAEGTGEDGDRRGVVYLLARGDLAAMDAADGAVDGSIALAAIAPGMRSRRIVGAPGDGLGYFLAVGEFDGDDQPDLAVGGTPGTLYLLAGADIPLLDAADGAEDGTADLKRAGIGDASWRLSGLDDAPGIEWSILDLATGDVDGDGVDDLVVSGVLGEYDDGFWTAKASFPSYVIPASALDAADRADGTRDRSVRLELAAEQEDSLVLMPGEANWGRRAFKSIVADIDGDGLGDVVFADGGGSGDWCQIPRWQGAAWLATGSYLSGLPAESAIALDELQPDGIGLWKFVGTGGERLGVSKPLASSLDGDGASELFIGSYGVRPYSIACGIGRTGAGTVVAISTGVLGEADASDGSADGVIHLGSIVGDYNAILDESLRVAITQFDENLVLMELSGETDALLRHQTSRLRFARKFYEVYEDAFDILIFQDNAQFLLADYACGIHYLVDNDVLGIGRPLQDARGAYGSARQLESVVWIGSHSCLSYDVLSHEIMHRWANFVLPSSGKGPHWGFTSANGVLGGFDRSKIVSLGGNRYTTGPIDRSRKYGPIELYLAGLLPAADVPDIWVARDGRITEHHDEHGWIFTASQVEEWSVERIIEEYGQRTPTVADSQKAFRAAFVLMADREHPFEQEVLEELSALIKDYSNPVDDADDGTMNSFNFYEATGGRATIATGELTRWLKPGAAALLAAGARAVDIRPLAASRSSRPFVVRQGTPRFGGATRTDPHLLCGTEHVGHGPWADSAFGSVDGPPPRFAGAEDSPGPYPRRR